MLLKRLFPGFYAFLLFLILFFTLEGCFSENPFLSGGNNPTPTPWETPESNDDGGINFTLPNLDGDMVSIRSFRGTPVLLAFFKTYCSHCREEAPALQAIAQKYGGSLVVLGIAVNEYRTEGVPIASFEEYAAMVRREFVQPYGWTFTVLIDDLGKVQRELAGTGVPSLVFVDAGGRVRGTAQGALSFSELDARIHSLLFSSG